MRVLIVEANVTTLRSLCGPLMQAGFAVDQTNRGGEGVELVRHGNHDAVIVSMNLPDMCGCDVVRRMRAAFIDTPVMMVFAPPCPDIVAALDAGADDCVASTVDDEEIIARTRAVIRRNRILRRPVIEVGSLMLDIGSRRAAVGDDALALTPKEYSILELLCLRRDLRWTPIRGQFGGLDKLGLGSSYAASL